MGDSHVGRMYPYRAWLEEHLREVQVNWSWQGGAGIHWAEQQVGCTGSYDMVVLMIGGNDLDNGCSVGQLANRVEHLANDIIRAGVQAVVITSLWPRSNTAYNTNAREYASVMERHLQGNPLVTFWLWDRRQAWRNYDGVHFLYHGYRQAMRYLISGIIWMVHHNIW